MDFLLATESYNVLQVSWFRHEKISVVKAHTAGKCKFKTLNICQKNINTSKRNIST